ncbi:hypothetical protein H6G81_12135 [Scytonema hofmannii FACHB-248]|uniref:Uncharacterized protein n=1 Tax=Scytonema hofmannii FACHB-248 TaxID=1842502 RepID=A0ABR8GR80_9CYAN|nr:MULTISPECIES: hypothetical protein [Nostocales]MBD2605263.1 hypothetical protein [Scytonema hofmannii FACHB-248]
MKRKISLVIALFVSFLLMFSPIAIAEETNFQIATISESVELKVVETPQDANKADSPSQVEVKVPAIDKPGISTKACVICPDGGWGRWSYITQHEQICLPNCN